MTEAAWYEPVMLDMDRRDQESARFEEFKKTEGYKECLQTGFEQALSDPDLVAEAVGPDGIRYPFDTNTIHRSPEKRKEIADAIKGFDRILYRNMAQAILTKDEALLGRIIMDHARAYLMEIAEEFVEDSWQEWDK